MPAFIDLPNGNVSDLAFTVAGWVASNVVYPDVCVLVDGSPVPFVFHARPDVQSALSLQKFVFTSGVMAAVELHGDMSGRSVAVEIVCDGEHVKKMCRVTSTGNDSSRNASRVSAPSTNASEMPATATTGADPLRIVARSWCIGHLRCAVCGGSAGDLQVSADEIVCKRCGVRYTQGTKALNLMSGSDRTRAGVVPTDNVSSNPYTPDALALIGRATGSGGWVLDCGAGARAVRLPHVVNLEIVDYISTDVLAIGESLPFADQSFDAVLSLAVLEHVRDPFACAREIMRVLKPGGEVLADVPFLQPVHGYPDHYFNMTQSGLMHLFAGAGSGEVIDCRVPAHGHPIFAVQWLLGAYLHGLSEEARASFGAMTIAEAASIIPHKFLAEPAATGLPPEAQALIGCLNTLLFRKSLTVST